MSRDALIGTDYLGRREVMRTSNASFGHTFLLQGRAHFFEKKMEISNTTMVGPIQPLDGFGIDLDDVSLKVETEFKHRFHRYFSASYLNILLNEQTIHMLTFNYEKRF